MRFKPPAAGTPRRSAARDLADREREEGAGAMDAVDAAHSRLSQKPRRCPSRGRHACLVEQRQRHHHRHGGKQQQALA
jgi:hypothetical protein